MVSADSITYQVVYDAAKAGYRYWWVPCAGVVGLGVGLAMLSYLNRRAEFVSSRFKVIGWAFVIGSPIWSGASFYVSYHDYSSLTTALSEGQFRVSEGRVSKFVPAGPWDDGEETFEVDGRRFSYAPSEITAGYNHSSRNGGPLRDGVCVRISDVSGEVARLETANARC